MDQHPDGESQPEQQLDPACSCGHSSAAHQFLSTRQCSFCSCLAFVAQVTEAIPPAPGGPASDADYILLRDMAEQLGVAASILRRAASKRAVPATKVAGRWAIRGQDVQTVAEHFLARETARRAQGTASHDMAAQRRHRGRLVSDPVRGQPALASPARRVETEALEHQLVPEETDHRTALARTAGDDDARQVEQVALEDILRPSPAPAPQRSL